MVPINPETAGRPDPDDPFFSARLTPYRSLGPRGFLALMLFTGAICFVGGLAFALMGAWPVMGFFGLDVAIVYVAFRLSYRQARAYEEVHVSTTEVRVVKVGARGETREFRLNPAWARIETEKVEGEGVIALSLVSHGRSLPVGGFLNPADRESFAGALGRALAAARSGGPVPAG